MNFRAWPVSKHTYFALQHDLPYSLNLAEQHEHTLLYGSHEVQLRYVAVRDEKLPDLACEESTHIEEVIVGRIWRDLDFMVGEGDEGDNAHQEKREGKESLETGPEVEVHLLPAKTPPPDSVVEEEDLHGAYVYIKKKNYVYLSLGLLIHAGKRSQYYPCLPPL